MKLLSAVRPWVILALVLSVAVYGFATTQPWHQRIWEPVGAKNFIYFLLACCVLGALSIWRNPTLTRVHLVALTLLVSVALLGPGPVAAVSFLVASCSALGDAVARLFYWAQGRRTREGRQPQAPMDSLGFAVSTLVGLALYVTFLALTAPRRIHFVAVWTVLLALPLVLNREHLKRLARFARQAFAPVPAISRTAALPLVVLGISLLAHLVLIPKPEAGADGLAMHLALPVRLATNHFFAYDPSVFLWSLMPMAGTFSFAIAYMLGGEAAARLLDFTLLALIVLILVRILRRWAPDWAAWLVVGIFVSTPLVQFVTTCVMTENAQTGFLLAAFASLVNAWKNPKESRDGESDTTERDRSVAAMLAGLLAGAALASKFGSFAIGLPIVVMAARAVPRRALAVAALFLAIGLPPYINAFVRTGNPLFPFANKIVPAHSEGAAPAFKDTRWMEKITWRTPYDLTFHSSRFYEGQDGGFGYQALLLLPLALAIPYRRWPQVTRAPFWLAVASAPFVLMSVPHLRYLYSPLAFASLALALPLAFGEPRFRRAAIACGGLAWALNLFFLASASFYQKDFLLNPFKSDAVATYERNMAPSDALASYVNLVQPGAAVAMLDCEVWEVAYFTGPVYMNNWHSGRGRIALTSAQTEDDVLSFARENGIHWFTGCRSDSSEAKSDSVAQRFFRRYTTDIFTAGNERLTRLRPDLEYSRELVLNNDFQDGFESWDNSQKAVAVPSEQAVQVTVTHYLNQRVPVEQGSAYRVSVRARCVEADTFTRLQVNWMDKQGHALPVSLVPVRCTPAWKDYSEVFTAPPDAGSGYLYVTGHTEKPVLVQRVSMAR